MALIHNDVFDAALTEIATCVEAEVQTAAGVALVDAITLDAGNFGSPAEGSPSGRQITCLVSDTSDMKSISVNSAGSASKVALKDASAAVLVEASITSAPISLGASDKVNLGTFNVVLQDPT